ncbi:MAG: sulfatase family protein [Planctomycetota bacterium]|jgi:arylsulfatase A-like enzyme
MRYFRALKTILNLRTFFVALIFAAIVYYYYSHQDWSMEVRITEDKRLDLTALISRAEAARGFNGRSPGLSFYCDPDFNEDIADLFVQADADSLFYYENIPIYPRAHLRLKCGIIEARKEGEFFPILFEVEIQSSERSEVLLSETITPHGSGRILQFLYRECQLSEWEDEECRLIFRCSSSGNYRPGDVLCGWGDVKIDSEGHRDFLKNIRFQRVHPAVDLLSHESLEAGRGGRSRTVWARDLKSREFTQHGPVEVDRLFTPFRDAEHPHWGQKPSIVFSRSHRLEMTGIEVPDEDVVALRFSLAMKEFASAAGGADFSVWLDGRKVFNETVSGKRSFDRWRDRGIDLSDHAGRTITLAFAVEYLPLARGAPRLEVPEGHPFAQGKTDLILEVLEPLAAFGQPRICYETELNRRFSSRRGEPNLIFVNVDGLASKYLGCYGSPYGLTSCMDRLSEGGVLFKDSVSCAPSSEPSAATLLTGLYPLGHGVGKAGNYYLEDRFLTLAEVLQAHHITTAAFVASRGLDRHTHLDQGFETYVALPGQNARKMNALFNDWLISRGEFRFFAYLHYADPMEPYNAPDGLRNRYVPDGMRNRDDAHGDVAKRIRAGQGAKSSEDFDKDLAFLKGRYFGEIAYLDRRLEELMKLLADFKLLNKTIVVLTSSHGTEFMEHGAFGHGMNLYEESICVPLIVWGPEGIVGRHRLVEGMVDHASIYATALEWMAIPRTEEILEGIAASLYPIEQRFGSDERLAWSELWRPPWEFIGLESPKRLIAVMNWQYKLINDGAFFELYNLADDPMEATNLIGQNLPMEKILREKMKGIRASIRDL